MMFGPMLARHDVPDLGCTHPGVCRYVACLISCLVSPTNAADNGLGQFCTAVLFTATSFGIWSGPPLAHHVAHIVSVCAEIQMLWVYASAVIGPRTVVQDIELSWDGSAVEFPRDAMSVSIPVVSANKPVSILTHASSPDPAAICFFDILPESFSECRPSINTDRHACNYSRRVDAGSDLGVLALAR
jgi:hypothetical protein